MKLNELKPNEGATKNKKRVGRGMGSGRGKTSTRGQDGQKSRSGYSAKRGFEGGQMPLHRRLPKRGFKNPFRKEYAVLNVSAFSKVDSEEVLIEDYKKLGFVKKYPYGIKVLGNGNIDKPLKIHAHKFSKSAVEKIEKAGGSCIVVKA